MRYFIYILLIFTLFSCKSKRKVVVEDYKKSVNPIDNPLDFSLDGVPDFKDIEPSASYSIEASSPNTMNDIYHPRTNAVIQISDKSEDITNKPNLGLIAHSVPTKMQVGKTYTVKLRISKENNKVQLVNGDIPIADSNIDSKITISSLRIEPLMSARLISDSSKISIQQTSTLIQNIDSVGFTEWEWRVTPLKGGDILLKIVVGVISDSESGRVKKDIPVYSEVVNIESNIKFTISNFIKEYWQ